MPEFVLRGYNYCERQCVECGEWFTARYVRKRPKFCGKKCYNASKARTMRQKRAAGEWRDTKPRHEPEQRACLNCGAMFTSKAKTHKHCSARCSRQRMWRISCKRRRARIAGAPETENVDSALVFKRDGHRCQICGGAVREDLPQFHPRKATLDHIVTLAEGGDHTYANCQAACWSCNYQKRHNSGGQTRLC